MAALEGFLPAERPAWAADLGCGTGWFGCRLLKAGCHVVFLDPSGEMLARAREATAQGDPLSSCEERFGMKMFEPDELRSLLERARFEPLSLIARTCLAQRGNEAWLADPARARELLAAEERIHSRPDYFGLAGHLQIAARKRG